MLTLMLVCILILIPVHIPMIRLVLLLIPWFYIKKHVCVYMYTFSHVFYGVSCNDLLHIHVDNVAFVGALL